MPITPVVTTSRLVTVVVVARFERNHGIFGLVYAASARTAGCQARPGQRGGGREIDWESQEERDSSTHLGRTILLLRVTGCGRLQVRVTQDNK
jgi:hypothetical protein